MEVYADILFLINFIALYLCLLPSVKSFKIRSFRHIISAAFGAVLAVIIFLGGFSGFLTVLGYILTAFTAFGKNIKASIMFFTVIILMHGAVSLFLSFGSGTDAFLKNGVLYFNISYKVFIFTFFAVFPIIVFLERVWKSSAKKKIHTIKITKDGKAARMCALYDSGNLLTELTSGKPVILVNRRSLQPLGTEQMLGRPYIIPYRSLGHNGAILGFEADEIILDNKKEISGAIVGICDERFGSGCDALIGGI